MVASLAGEDIKEPPVGLARRLFNATPTKVAMAKPIKILNPIEPPTLRWAYGVTTLPVRRKTYLPQTLASLKDGGFPTPTLFVDGTKDIVGWETEFKLPVVARSSTIRTYGNWILGLAELYIREPNCDRYAMFQDDFVTYRNLRGYLERVNYPDKGYCNLYTFPQNNDAFPRIGKTARFRHGWWMSNQRGLGAVALVFNREAVITLLTHQHMVERPADAHRGWKNIDGGIVTALRKAGWHEYVHNPSLVQHIGLLSSMRNRQQQHADRWLGEDFDAMELLKDVSNPPGVIAK